MPRKRQPDEGASARLIRVREAAGFTQRELADAFGVTGGAIAQWESGDRSIPGPVLRLLEMYEEQLGLGDLPKRTKAGPGWLERSGTQALASFMWFGLQGIDAGGGSPIAAELKRAALRNYVRKLGELKALAMKFGQMYADMSLLLPAEEQEILRTIYTSAKPMPAHEVHDVLLSEFGKTPAQLFRKWSPMPVAVASIGQVHRAELLDGRNVAVKIQHPKMVEMLRSDLRNVDLLDRAWTIAVRAQERGVIHGELRARLLEECDYAVEAQNLADFRRFFVGQSGMLFPETIAELSTARVFTTTWMPGERTDGFVRDASQSARNRAGALIWRYYYEALFRHGAFNADPNQGNFLFADDGVVFLDFGRVKRLAPAAVELWKDALRALLERDIAAYRRVLIAMGCVPSPEGFDFHYSYRAMLLMYRPCLSDRPFRFTTDYVRRLWGASSGKNVNAARINYPSELVFLSTLYLSLNAFLAKLDAELDCRSPMLSLVYPKGQPHPPPFSAEELEDLEAGF